MDDIDRFLEEDIGSGDVTTQLFVPDTDGHAVITCEDDAVVAGLSEAEEVFSRLGVSARRTVEDGTRVRPGTKVMEIDGPLRGMTTAERTALNIMMRMSGIATMVNDATVLCRKISPAVVISGTRKTTPGFRSFEKKAIALGGGEPHRFGLYDMILVKDNHIAAAGGLRNIMERIRGLDTDIKVEVEVENAEDARDAALNGADIIMLDNRSPEEAKELYALIKSCNPSAVVEVSGRVTMDNVAEYAGCADRISMGCITHSVTAIHFSMSVE
ncbi:MAG: carboxylating nicotinate-nucleotide diphosphorylase [Candidatus Methanomethylophilaceae archaeon]